MTALVKSSTTAPPTDCVSPAAGLGRDRVLALSTIAFTIMFAVWLMFGILAIPIRAELGLSDVQFSWLTAIAILNGSIWRLPFGILADRLGGRLVMIVLILLTAIPTFLVSFAESYAQLLVLAFLLGMAGNSFSVGIAWNAVWFPRKSQGFTLGVFGAGNVGASVTKLVAPPLLAIVPAAGWLGGLIPGGWRLVPFIYACALVLTALAVWALTPHLDYKPAHGRPLREMIRPLGVVRVWRFSLYYVAVFGAYVALSVWLPKYYHDVYHLPLASAGLLTTLFIFPASLLRPLGGYLSDRFGPRRVMYAVLAAMIGASLLLALPDTTLSFAAAGGTSTFNFSTGVSLFTFLIVIIGIAMGIGKAAVYRYIPDYFPHDIGAVGGLVGALGALGGFFLPPAFAYLQGWTGIPQMTFLVLAGLSAACLLWLHLTVWRMSSSSLNRPSIAAPVPSPAPV